MEWIRVTIHTVTEGIELLCEYLSEIGISGFEIEDAAEFNEFLENNTKYWDYVDDELYNEKQGDTKVKFYIENNAHSTDTLACVKTLLESLDKEKFGTLKIETDGMNEEDWANNWKKYFKPIKVGKKVLIQPQWCKNDEETNRIVFTVNPGMTFGTGTHASTRLCICELEKYVNSDTCLLDAGCGSGILSIISLMLGAKDATAADIDENCIHVAYENAQMNSVNKENYHVYSGDITKDEELFDKISKKKYDIIVANIVADVIISLLPTVKKLIKDGGVFICSGIIRERLSDVTKAMEREHIEVYDINEADGWVEVTCRF